MRQHPPGKIPSYPLFDWLRFLLASIVVFGHSGLIPWKPSGNLAVQVFFALSGWLIGGILIEGDAKSLPRFYFNRAARIWVPYFCTVAALYTVSALREPVTDQWFKFLIYDVTFTHNWFALWPDAPAALAQMPESSTGNQFWSIAVEEQFYLVAPVLAYSTRFGKSALVWAIIFAVVLALGLTDFASITAGVCAACYWRRSFVQHVEGWTAPALIVAILVAAVALSSPSAYPYAAPFFSIAVVLALAIPGERGKLGSFLGSLSYPIYLNAWIGAYIANALVRHVLPDLAFVHGLVTIVAVLGVAAMSYFAIDRNVMARRAFWYSPRLGVAIAVLAYALLAGGILFGVTVRRHAA